MATCIFICCSFLHRCSLLSIPWRLPCMVPWCISVTRVCATQRQRGMVISHYPHTISPRCVVNLLLLPNPIHNRKRGCGDGDGVALYMLAYTFQFIIGEVDTIKTRANVSRVADMKEHFVIDPLISKRQQLLLATQLCRMVLKVRSITSLLIRYISKQTRFFFHFPLLQSYHSQSLLYVRFSLAVHTLLWCGERGACAVHRQWSHNASMQARDTMVSGCVP